MKKCVWVRCKCYVLECLKGCINNLNIGWNKGEYLKGM